METTDRHFHPYVEGEPARTYTRSLEGALIVAIGEAHAHRHGIEARIHAAAMLLGIPSEDGSF